MTRIDNLMHGEGDAIERLSARKRLSSEQLEGVRKAAILMVALDPEVAGPVFGQLTEEDMELVSQEIASLGLVDKLEMTGVLEEFKDLVMVQDLIKEGGYEHAINLIQSSLPKNKATKLVRLLEAQRQSIPFNFLQHTESEVLVTFLQEEHPQTIALVLSYVEPSKAAEILTSMTPEKRIDVVKRIALLGHTSPDAIKNVESGLRKYLASLAFEEYQEVGGIGTVSEILNVLDRATERVILETIEEEDPDLAEEIKKLMFVFEDLLLVDDKGIQNVLKEVENSEVALALKTASDQLKQKIFSNMSKRAAEMVQEEMSFMGPVRVSDVEAAQQSIVEVVRRLEESGDVVIMGRGGESSIVA